MGGFSIWKTQEICTGYYYLGISERSYNRGYWGSGGLSWEGPTGFSWVTGRISLLENSNAESHWLLLIQFLFSDVIASDAAGSAAILWIFGLSLVPTSSSSLKFRVCQRMLSRSYSHITWGICPKLRLLDLPQFHWVTRTAGADICSLSKYSGSR